MKLPLQYIFSIIFILSSFGAHAQDTTAVKTRPGLAIYVDYGKILTMPTSFETKMEAGLEYLLGNKFIPNVQFGMASLEPSGALKNGVYEARGWYARAGVNYLIPVDAVNSLYVGVKYGMSEYEESGTYEIESHLWPIWSESYHRKYLNADWFEIILGSEKRLKTSHWYLGGYLTVRIINKREKFEPIDAYAIPGYGRAMDKKVPGVNFYIKYKL